jgi:hypothetical protein
LNCLLFVYFIIKPPPLLYHACKDIVNVYHKTNFEFRDYAAAGPFF